MRLAWALVAGIAVGGGLGWWAARDTPAQARRKQDRASAARAAAAEEARPVLYRWRDAHGRLQVTETPPAGPDAGRRYERIDREPRPGIEVHGGRD